MTENQRIEQAASELGHTDLRRRTALLLVIVTLATAVLVATIDQVEAHRATDSAASIRSFSRTSFAAIAAAAKSRDVRAANRALRRAFHDFESALETRSMLREALPAAQLMLYRGLGSGNEKVYAGHDGWLYYREAVDHLIGRPFLGAESLARRAANSDQQIQPNPLPAIVDFASQLEARGIKLLVLPIPVKAAIVPEHLAIDAIAPVANPSTAELFARLAAAGVRVLDPTAILLTATARGGKPLFLRTDTHWSGAGVELVANAVATEIRTMAELPPSDGCTVEVRPWRDRGDLATMLPLPAFAQIPAESHELSLVVRIGDAAPWPPDRSSPVLLLGDSFANIFSRASAPEGLTAGLTEQLGCALGFPVDAIVQLGGGSAGTRRALQESLGRGDDRLAGKRVVVWQWSMRELSSGHWPVLSLRRAPNAASRTARHEGRVTAMVRSVAPTPRPGTTPYRDCLVALRLGLDQDRSDILAYVWGLRDGRLTAAASLQPGTTITVILQPWASVEPELGTFQRIEPQDDETALLDAYFGELGTP